MKRELEKVKVIIVGAGPAGISTAIEVKARKIEPVLVLEKSDTPCNTIVKLYKPGKRIDADYKEKDVKPLGICKFTTETREEFLERVKKWIEEWKIEIRVNSEVTDIKKKDGLYEIWVNDKPQYLTEYVVIAIGIFGAPNKPDYPIPKEARNQVFFEIPDNPPENQKILVVGGGNTAAETALYLCNKNEVYLSYRRKEFFRINEVNLNHLKIKEKEGKIKLLLGTDIERIEKNGDKIRVYFKQGITDVYDMIIYCLGGITPKKFLQKIGIDFNERGNPILTESLETNLPKVFLAGDLAVKNGNIMKAFNTGYIIAEKIMEYERKKLV